MKKLLALVLLTPLIQANYVDRGTYKMNKQIIEKGSKVTYLQYYCIGNVKWLKVYESKIGTKNESVLYFEPALGINKERINCPFLINDKWEEQYK